MKLVYMCRAEFKNGGLRQRPLTENGGAFRTAPHGKKQGVLELKITKKPAFVLKRGSFRSAQVGKAEQRIVYF